MVEQANVVVEAQVDLYDRRQAKLLPVRTVADRR
jgi:hypothetical protein